jgi:hypothetical protein
MRTKWRGVQPMSSCALMDALASSSACTHSRRPFDAALCSGVAPSESRASTAVASAKASCNIMFLQSIPFG